jgi:hypothetical protein
VNREDLVDTPPVSTAPAPAPPASPPPPAPAPAPPAARLGPTDVALLAWLAVCAVLLFARLGTYALWDDEANTAIFAANVWKTGDTLAYDGTNLVAFREGLELSGIKNRAYPPGQYFFAAPFLGLLGNTALAARLPFALAAFAGFVLWAWWLRRARAPWPTLALTFLFAVGNVSLFLYSRQARYYGLAWALSLGLFYLYVHRAESRRFRVAFALGSVALLAVHYLAYGATMVCLAVDYVAFEWRRGQDTWRQRLAFLGVQAVGAVAIVGVFFPFGRKVTPYVPASWLHDKLVLAWWNLRDLDTAEFFFLPMLAVALGVWAAGRFKDTWLLRGAVALGLYAAVASVLSVQPVGWAVVSDIRYMSPTIPLGIALSARTLSGTRPWLRGVGLALGAFLALSTPAWRVVQEVTKAPNVMPARSTLVAYLGELASPQRSAYREAAEWLTANVPPGAQVWVLPDYGVYPLIFHAPQLHYMWQLRSDQRAEYPTLAPYHFKYQSLPDVIVAFGGEVGNARGAVSQLTQRGAAFEPEVRLGVVGPDQTRPELFWRSFVTAPVRNPDSDGTYIFRRRGP